MSPPFIITEHAIDCQYIREYPRATTPQNAPLKLHVKKYTPVDNQRPQPGDVTLIGAPGAGCPKELYEPLWEDILARSKHDGFRIRAIWAADSFSSGTSGVLNEGYLGNDPSWFDHSRDIIQLIQQLRDDMPQPIMGIGHSAGAVSLMFASLIHPRLMHSLILLEPFVHRGLPVQATQWIIARSRQGDIWRSRAEARDKTAKLIGAYDPRVRDRFAQVAFRELPTPLYPVREEPSGPSEGEKEKGVALTTPVAQEVALYMRPNLRRRRQLGVKHGEKEDTAAHDAVFLPDMIGPMEPGRVSYRPEPVIVFSLLAHLRPGALYISGETSVLQKAGLQKQAADKTGTRVGGSGGVEYGRVKHVVLKAGHMHPFERVSETAEGAGEWIATEAKRWREEESRINDGWKDLSARERIGLSKEWQEMRDINEKMFPVRKQRSKI
ncbi:Alpha/beta hydrolase family-domain-containing protein [Aspergillus unguis]